MGHGIRRAQTKTLTTNRRGNKAAANLRPMIRSLYMMAAAAAAVAVWPDSEGRDRQWSRFTCKLEPNHIIRALRTLKPNLSVTFF